MLRKGMSTKNKITDVMGQNGDDILPQHYSTKVECCLCGSPDHLPLYTYGTVTIRLLTLREYRPSIV